MIIFLLDQTDFQFFFLLVFVENREQIQILSNVVAVEIATWNFFVTLQQRNNYDVDVTPWGGVIICELKKKSQNSLW